MALVEEWARPKAAGPHWDPGGPGCEAPSEVAGAMALVEEQGWSPKQQVLSGTLNLWGPGGVGGSKQYETARL